MAAQSDLCFRFAGSDGAAFDVVRFELTEGLSRPFRLELELSSPDANIGLDALLDSEAAFTIERDGEPVRTVHGIVTMFEQGETGFRRTRYRAVVEPALARLGLWHGSRIHQQLSVPDIRTSERSRTSPIPAAMPASRVCGTSHCADSSRPRVRCSAITRSRIRRTTSSRPPMRAAVGDYQWTTDEVADHEPQVP